MALQAVGWLSSKLGVNMTGKGEPKNSTDGGAETQRGGGGGVLDVISDTVFGASGSGENKRYAADGTEVDEQGLPVGRDWYYYDETLGRFNVRPDAPAEVREEHARQVAAYEAEKNGASQAVAPPPPPPPPPVAAGAAPPPMMARPAGSPQYADAGYFS